jgi:hypothetical protein
MARSLHLACLAVLCFGPLCLGQTITVRVINANNGRPIPKQPVTVSLLFDNPVPALRAPTQLLSLQTDANGAAQVQLPEPPPAHLSASARLEVGKWHCLCAAIPMLAVTQDIVQSGMVIGSPPKPSSKRPAPKAAPGEILCLAERLSFFERLTYPLSKW